ncbi:glucose-inhibited division protein A [Klebsiella quasipneumoniae]|nr:glucose-inhibited division protein A [Klebsiella quasipneumoniae]
MCSVFCSFRRRRGVYACWLKINSSMARIIKKAFQNRGFSKKLTFTAARRQGFSKSVQYL